jgi:hypothetical protein
MEISIRLLQQSDLSTADRVFRLAFGTFIGLPELTHFGINSESSSSIADKNTKGNGRKLYSLPFTFTSYALNQLPHCRNFL